MGSGICRCATVRKNTGPSGMPQVTLRILRPHPLRCWPIAETPAVSQSWKVMFTYCSHYWLWLCSGLLKGRLNMKGPFLSAAAAVLILAVSPVEAPHAPVRVPDSNAQATGGLNRQRFPMGQTGKASETTGAKQNCRTEGGQGESSPPCLRHSRPDREAEEATRKIEKTGDEGKKEAKSLKLRRPDSRERVSGALGPT